MDDFEIDEELVRSLLHEQHPDLAGLGLHLAATGWSNELWRLGDKLAMRLPRRERASSELRNEQQWLPTLAPRFPLPVPTPMRIGEPSARFRWPWTVTAGVPGEPGDRAPISDGSHAADTLAGFLRALHLDAPAEVPVNPMRGVPLATLTHEFDKKVHAIASSGVATDVREIWDDAVSAPDWEGPPVWLHGDLHPANVVVSDRTLSGVIDFFWARWCLPEGLKGLVALVGTNGYAPAVPAPDEAGDASTPLNVEEPRYRGRAQFREA
ncbi:hypothetical protein GCM10023075_33960 [Streptosporangium album]|uniref:phosphotransferase n=1 Tax=Streptosporangium album TaxID=47479 RepID=UPI0031F180EE